MKIRCAFKTLRLCVKTNPSPPLRVRREKQSFAPLRERFPAAPATKQRIMIVGSATKTHRRLSASAARNNPLRLCVKDFPQRPQRSSE
jgi:hypothetical protein